MVQTNTVQGPGYEAGVIRIKGTGTAHSIMGTASAAPSLASEQGASAPEGAPAHHGILATLVDLIAASTPLGEAAIDAANPGGVSSEAQPHSAERALKPERGLAMALAGNGRWCYLDPKLGAMHAVAEAARKVACTGATPVAATNCLNFGNPQKPEIMAQLSQAIDGIAEACTALGTPITGGNVSLYNETLGEGIYPTPVIAVVGILDDVTKAVPSAFQQAGDTILFLSAIRGAGRQAQRDLGASAWAHSQGWPLWGEPVVLDLNEEAALHKALAALAAADLLRSAADISDGGFLTAAAKSAIASGLGANLTLQARDAEPFSTSEVLFAEIASSVVATCAPENVAAVRSALAAIPGVFAAPVGTVERGTFHVQVNGANVIDTTTAALRSSYTEALESDLSDEVLA